MSDKSGVRLRGKAGVAGVALGVMSIIIASAVTAAPSDSQIELGRKVYEKNCAACHGGTFAGAFGPPLSGKTFVSKWLSANPDAFAEHVRTMPPSNPGGLGDEEYEALTALLRIVNGLPEGPPSRAGAKVEPTGEAPVPNHEGAAIAGPVDETYQKYRARLQALVDHLPPVTDAMLQNPDPADWLNWRRTRDSLGFSPLKQINKDNVARLSVAWALPLGPGSNGITPIVHGGVIFVDSGSVQALDARTGDVIWRFKRTAKPARLPTTQAHGLAIYGDSIYQPTTDNHVIALDMRTGQVRWDTVLAADPKDLLQILAAPLAVKGKIIQGMSGCQGTAYKGGCFISALDAATGKEVWRFHTIARPGQPGGDSWNGAPVDRRFGGSVWTAPSYDPDLDLLYVGTGQTYNISTLLGKTSGRPGQSNDALFTDSTLALRPDTGALAWHYQHFPGDVWDLDWAFEQTILPIHGRKTVLTIGKLGIIDALDAKTGRYLWSKDLGLQNLVTGIDPNTGRKIYDRNKLPAQNEQKTVCPGASGARSWPATAVDPGTGKLFVPMAEGCMSITLLSTPDRVMGGMGVELIKRPDSDGNFGRVAAVDLYGGKDGWTHRGRAASASAILATAGGLVFEGSLDRRFRARDSETGDVLWEVRLDDSPLAYPISFMADGNQYVAVVTGGGMPWDLSFRVFTPEEQAPIRQRTLWVFKLSK